MPAPQPRRFWGSMARRAALVAVAALAARPAGADAPARYGFSTEIATLLGKSDDAAQFETEAGRLHEHS